MKSSKSGMPSAGGAGVHRNRASDGQAPPDETAVGGSTVDGVTWAEQTPPLVWYARD
ncbi:MAG UNVERIFIED_CONTAM: hypothetical protein LVT10_02685 [Anaerolineae bacterium]